jgi:hypothetical protein
VQDLTAAPDLDGWAITERLLKDPAPLEQRLWLVIDDVHGLRLAAEYRPAAARWQPAGNHFNPANHVDEVTLGHPETAEAHS